MSVVRDWFVRLPLICGVALGLASGLPSAFAGDLEDSQAETRAVMDELDRPLLREREAAVARLLERLPGIRPRIISALRDGSWTVQLHAAQILARDGSPEAMAALLAHLGRTDESQATLIQLALVKDVAASKTVLAAFRRRDAALRTNNELTRKRLDHLRNLLLRAEIEDKFIAKKSKTGGTGYYRGQYDDLRYQRDLALDICTRIAMDRAFAVPGLFRTGRYTFLRPNPHEYWEVQSMAANAISDLAKPTDERVILRLDAHAGSLEVKCIGIQKKLHRRRFSMSDDYEAYIEMQLDLMEAVGDWGDILATLCLVDEERYRDRVEEYLDVLDTWNVYNRSLLRHTRAGMLIRVGWYERAIRAYREVLVRSSISRATSYYNLACAYASWSREPGKRDADVLKIRAIDELTDAVESGWSDVGWMQEDRDLDPIKQMDEYKALVERIKREVLPPEPGPPAVGSPDGDAIIPRAPRRPGGGDRRDGG